MSSTPLPHPFVGRARELAALEAALDEAMRGRGGVWFLCGEAGIGKSRLAEEVARRASTRGLRVAWGRCWEEGTAPAYWPWLQILRQLLADDDERAAVLVGGRKDRLAQLLPELGDGAAPVDVAEATRFGLYDAAASTLWALARRRPLLLVLEDLHAADASSLALLELVTGPLATHPLLVLGTFREADTLRAAGGPALARLVRQGRLVSLPRLPRVDVASFVEASLGEAPSAALVEALCTTTEGHPLFLVETTRLLAVHGAPRAGEALAMPPTVRAAIGERLLRLSPACRQALAVASVVGRDVRRELLAVLGIGPMATLATWLAEAVDADVLAEPAPGHYRFTHILVREVVYRELAPDERARWHGAIAQALEDGALGEPRPAEVMHHQLNAGDAAAAARAAARAGQVALRQLAFAEAASLFGTGLEALDRAVEAAALPFVDADTLRIELEIERGRALMLAGDVADGKRLCQDAAARAKTAGSSVLLARAALAYGSVSVLATVEPTLVDLLRAALDAQPASEVGTRARLMARLAAAMQPVTDREPDEPIALAREASALAASLGDPRARLETLRAAGGALMDLVPARERIAWNREQTRLAEALGDATSAVVGRLRTTVDLYETGDVAGASAMVDEALAATAGLDQPSHRWRLVALRATRAFREGRFDEGWRLTEEARVLGERARDPNVARSLALHRAAALLLEGRFDELAAWLPQLHAHFRDGYAEPMIRTFIAASFMRIGRVAEAAPFLDEESARAVIRLRDQTSLESLGYVIRALGDEALAGAVLERLEPHAGRFVSGGVTGLTWDGPTSLTLALLAEARGQHDDAVASYERAHREALATSARPHAALIAYEHARALERRDPAAARARLADARRAAEDLGMAGLVALIDGGAPREPVPAAARGQVFTSFTLRRDGELWLVEHAGRRFHLRDGKGVRWLARLVEEPGRELHVLDLVGEGGETDAGDAGVLIDATARAAYQRRVGELRESLEEAEALGDIGRAERARAELDAIGSELARAVGLGGRDRRAGQAAERARINVQRRLRDALDRITEQDAELGRYLTRAVRTGAFCCYEP